jgi:hypothetical protein
MDATTAPKPFYRTNPAQVDKSVTQYENMFEGPISSDEAISRRKSEYNVMVLKYV